MFCKVTFIAVVALFGVPSFCQSKVPMTPINCRISWNEVETYRFTVRWQDPSKSCAFFRVHLYHRYETKEMEMFDKVATEYMVIENVAPSTIYGVKVTCFDAEGHQSALSRAARTRTFGHITTKATTTTPPPTVIMPVGTCGPNNFTCKSNSSECISKEFWCDREMDCKDGSDEMNCAGHCTMIKKFHVGGNFSCSRWNSRRSACFFQCNGEFIRDGPYYTMCIRSRWNRDMPTCRLQAPKFDVMNNMTTNNSITFHIHPMVNAMKFVVSVTDMNGNEIKTKLSTVSKNDIMEGSVDHLQEDKAYNIILAAEDSEGQLGFKSKLIGKTAYSKEDGKEINPK